ncbi:MAG: hypothetical protein AB8B73_07205 [Ekhidna sp.]
MDNLKLLWNDLKEDTHQMTDFSKSEIQTTINQKSKGVMKTLAKKVYQKFIYCLIFTLMFAVIIPFAGAFATKILLSILLAAYIIGDVLLWQEYQELKKHIDVMSNLLDNMKMVRTRIKSVIKYEQLVGLAIYPISVVAGLLLGMSIGKENPTLMDKTSDWIVMVVSILVVVPISHWAAKAMNKKAFGKYLDKLDRNIVELETIES